MLTSGKRTSVRMVNDTHFAYPVGRNAWVDSMTENSAEQEKYCEHGTPTWAFCLACWVPPNDKPH